MTPLIKFENISKVYKMGESELYAVNNVSFCINRGEYVAIVGQSGSGKSTCMNIIGCLDVPTVGQYYLDGEDVSRLDEYKLAKIRNRMLGFIFQQYNLLPKLNAVENVKLPLVYSGIDENLQNERAMAALSRVGIAHKRNNFPSQLSGGEQQRVSIARALAGEPSVILADEPTGALDSKTGREVMAFLKELNAQGNTIVLITHDNDIASQVPRIIRLQDGKVIYDGCPNNDIINKGQLFANEGVDAI